MLTSVDNTSITEPAQRKEFSMVIAGHGSRDCDGIKEFEDLVSMMRSMYPQISIEHGYLEFVQPTVDDAIRTSIANGAQRIAIVPALLTAATHAKNDMPSELTALRKEFPTAELYFGAALDLHPRLLQLSQRRIVNAENESPNIVRRSDTCLVVVGRGTSDPDANSEISKLARMLEEGMGFGLSFTCYSGMAKPLVADGLRAAAKLGHTRIIVFPYFLFDGLLIKRIYNAADSLQRRFPDIEVLKAKYLGVHPHVTEVLFERACEGIEGRAHMNCSLCKYRTQIVGFESQVGEPQQGHHYASKGKSTKTSVYPLDCTTSNSATSPSIQAQPLVNTRCLSDALDPDETQSPSDTLDSRETQSQPDTLESGEIQSSSDTRYSKKTQSPLTRWEPYTPHPIEAASFQIIEHSRDWSCFDDDVKKVLQRLVHTTGDLDIVDDIFISSGAVDIGIRALLRCRRVVTDVTMVEAGLNRKLLTLLSINTWCGVHDPETQLIAEASGITRSAAGIRRAWQKWGNDVLIAIGDAPTAVFEAVRLVKEQKWRPQLVIGLPVGFVGTVEAKLELHRCLQIPRITNSGTRGGSPWASSVINAFMIAALNRLAAYKPTEVVNTNANTT